MNNRRLALYVVVEDGNGKGAAVGYSLLGDETRECIEFFVRTLKTNNEVMNTAQCFIVDKDFTEIAVVSSEFPSAKVQLCLFNVLKTFQLEMNKLTMDDANQQKLREVVQDLVYASTEDG